MDIKIFAVVIGAVLILAGICQQRKYYNGKVPFARSQEWYRFLPLIFVASGIWHAGSQFTHIRFVSGLELVGFSIEIAVYIVLAIFLWPRNDILVFRVSEEQLRESLKNVFKSGGINYEETPLLIWLPQHQKKLIVEINSRRKTAFIKINPPDREFAGIISAKLNEEFKKTNPL